MHDGLIFELKDFYTLDNIVKKQPMTSTATSGGSSEPLKLAGLEFGRPKPVVIPQDISSANIKNFQDQDIFKIVDKKWDQEDIIYDESKSTSKNQE